mmetsp:Transcript_86700/g.280140  ORF Transcript_86700/g.280140 Transcript_86700/m.280140 type:complete len:326 (-) Transcript_86700:861-1838(-)
MTGPSFKPDFLEMSRRCNDRDHCRPSALAAEAAFKARELTGNLCIAESRSMWLAHLHANRPLAWPPGVLDAACAPEAAAMQTSMQTIDGCKAAERQPCSRSNANIHWLPCWQAVIPAPKETKSLSIERSLPSVKSKRTSSHFLASIAAPTVTPKATGFGTSMTSNISCRDDSAAAHKLPALQARTSLTYVTKSGCTPAFRIFPNMTRTSGHCPALEHDPIAIFHALVIGGLPSCRAWSNNHTAACQQPAPAHATTAAVHAAVLTLSGKAEACAWAMRPKATDQTQEAALVETSRLSSAASGGTVLPWWSDSKSSVSSQSCVGFSI